MREQITDPKRRRRAFIGQLVRVAVGAVAMALYERLPATAWARELAFRHTHTGESLSLLCTSGGAFDTAGLDRVDHFLRDFRTGELHRIDPGLLDFLGDLHRETGSNGVFEVISGYRSPATNAMLRGKSSDVAKKSLHMQGRAIDVRLTDVATADLRDAAIRLKRGGVGYYPKSDFVHLDTGRFRTW
jgi:uncharacterized protein YcbK (DUF882 family)